MMVNRFLFQDICITHCWWLGWKNNLDRYACRNTQEEPIDDWQGINSNSTQTHLHSSTKFNYKFLGKLLEEEHSQSIQYKFLFISVMINYNPQFDKHKSRAFKKQGDIIVQLKEQQCRHKEIVCNGPEWVWMAQQQNTQDPMPLANRRLSMGSGSSLHLQIRLSQMFRYIFDAELRHQTLANEKNELKSNTLKTITQTKLMKREVNTKI